jgi:hypothetical protein
MQLIQNLTGLVEHRSKMYQTGGGVRGLAITTGMKAPVGLCTNNWDGSTQVPELRTVYGCGKINWDGYGRMQTDIHSYTQTTMIPGFISTENTIDSRYSTSMRTQGG